MSEHGTYAGYGRHKLGGWKDQPCEACRHANASYMRLYRASRTTRCARGLGWPERLTGRALAVITGEDAATAHALRAEPVRSDA